MPGFFFDRMAARGSAGETFSRARFAWCSFAARKTRATDLPRDSTPKRSSNRARGYAVKVTLFRWTKNLARV